MKLFLQMALAFTFAVSVCVGLAVPARAATDLGNGTGALIGNDLTDLGNDGNGAAYAPPNLAGFDAVFFGNDEPNFDPPNNEGAFNVFDNLLGGGQNKWCCNSADNGGLFVGADFTSTLPPDGYIVLTRFTIGSDNDVGITRDPDVWKIEGSMDGTNWFDIFVWNKDGNSVFDDFGGDPNQRVIQFDTGVDFSTAAPARYLRYHVTSSVNNANHSLGELEFFGDVRVPEPMTLLTATLGLGALGLYRRRRRA